MGLVESILTCISELLHLGAPPSGGAARIVLLGVMYCVLLCTRSWASTTSIPRTYHSAEQKRGRSIRAQSAKTLELEPIPTETRLLRRRRSSNVRSCPSIYLRLAHSDKLELLFDPAMPLDI